MRLQAEFKLGETGTVKFQAESTQDLIKHAAFFQALPTVCPVDGSPVRFFHRAPDGNDYYGLESTGVYRFQFPIGQLKDPGQGPGLFVKDKWEWYDHDRPHGERNVVVWDRGEFYPDKLPPGFNEHMASSKSPRESKQKAPKTKTEPKWVGWTRRLLSANGVAEADMPFVLAELTGGEYVASVEDVTEEMAREIKGRLAKDKNFVKKVVTQMNEDPAGVAPEGDEFDNDTF